MAEGTSEPSTGSNTTKPKFAPPLAQFRDLTIVGDAADMVRRLVATHEDRLSNLSSNPKGMTHGDVQRDLTDCKRILSGDA